MYAARTVIDPVERRSDPLAAKCRRPAGQVARRDAEDDLAIVDVGEAKVGTGKGELRQQVPHMPRFRLGALHEFKSRRHIEKQVAHRHHGSDGHAARLDLPDIPPLAVNLRPFDPPVFTAGKGKPGDGRNRREGFPPESKGFKAEKVTVSSYLARRVPLQGKKSIFLRHAASVVGHPEQPLAA